MAELLVYDFRIINERALDQALSSNERRIAQHNARVGRAVGGTPVARAVRAGRATGATQEQREAARAQAYWQRAHQRAADFRIRQDDRVHQTRLRQIEREERVKRGALEREARAQQRAAVGEARAREQAAASLDRQRSRALLAQHRATERDGRRLRAERLGVAQGVVGRIGGTVASTIGSVGGIAGMALGIGGSFALGSATQTQMSEAAKASQLANQAGRPEIKGELLRESQNVKGFTGMEALGGLESFVTKTGDLDSARQALGPLSELALATGSNLEDLGQTAGQVFNVLKGQITDPVERMKQLQMIMGTLAQQGSLGAVEIRDLATEFGKLGAASRGFEGGAPELLRSMGAFAQIAMEKGGASTSADAATAVGRLAGDIVTKKEKFKNLGVNIQSKTDKTKLRAPEEIMLDVLKATGGDIMKTSGLFGLESKKVFSGMAATYSEAEAREKGTGEAAARAEFERYAGAQSDPESIRERAQSRLTDTDLQFKEAQKRFNAEVGTKLLPVLTDLVPKFTELIPSIAKAVEFFAKLVDSAAKDPVGSIGKLIAAKVALDLAGAGIGSMARGALERIFSGIPGGGGGIAGAGGVAGAGKLGMALGAAGIGGAIGAPVAAAIYAGGVANFEAGESSIAESGQKLNFIRSLRGGNVSQQQFEQARTEIDAQEQRVRELGKTSMFDDFMGLFGASNREVEKKSQETILADMRETFASVAEEMRNSAKAQSDAAQKLAMNGGVNRSDSPSPIKK